MRAIKDLVEYQLKKTLLPTGETIKKTVAICIKCGQEMADRSYTWVGFGGALMVNECNPG